MFPPFYYFRSVAGLVITVIVTVFVFLVVHVDAVGKDPDQVLESSRNPMMVSRAVLIRSDATIEDERYGPNGNQTVLQDKRKEIPRDLEQWTVDAQLCNFQKYR